MKHFQSISASRCFHQWLQQNLFFVVWGTGLNQSGVILDKPLHFRENTCSTGTQKRVVKLRPRTDLHFCNVLRSTWIKVRQLNLVVYRTLWCIYTGSVRWKQYTHYFYDCIKNIDVMALIWKDVVGKISQVSVHYDILTNTKKHPFNKLRPKWYQKNEA